MAKKKRLQQATPAPQRVMTKRQLTRYQREQQQIRRIVILLSVALAVSLLVLLIPIYINVIVNPNRTVATVEGQNLNRATYDKQRRWDLYNQVNQAAFYYQYSSQSGQQQGNFTDSTQYKDLLSQINSVSSAPLDATSLGTLVDNTLTVRHASDFNLQYSETDVVSNTVAEQAPPPQPATETPSPVLSPTPSVTGTPPTVTPIITPTSTLSPTNTSTPLPTFTPGGPTATPTITPTPSQTATVTDTPIPVAGASETAVARYGALIKDVSGNKPDPNSSYCRLACPGLSKDDYIRIVAEPQYVKKQITTILQGKIETTTLQLQLSQIQADNEDDAKAAQALLAQGTGFQDVARQKSTDTATKDKGGDMGWQAKGQQSAEFDSNVFAANPEKGKLIGPFKDDAGWHIVLVTDKAEKRELSGEQISSLKNKVFDNWLADLKKKAEANKTIVLAITPTLTSVPVPTAPPPPTVPPAETPTIATTNPITGTNPVTGTNPLTGTNPVTSTNPTTNTDAAPATTIVPTAAATAPPTTVAPAPTASPTQ